MTRSLTMNDYRAEVWAAQKLVEQVFFYRARPRRSWVVARMGLMGTHVIRLLPAGAGLRREQALWGRVGGIRVFPGGMKVPGVLRCVRLLFEHEDEDEHEHD
jgi:hypothetical protein